MADFHRDSRCKSAKNQPMSRDNSRDTKKCRKSEQTTDDSSSPNDQSPLTSSTNRRTFMKTTGVLGVAAGLSQVGIGSVAADHSGTYDVDLSFVRLDSHVFGGYHEPETETERSNIAFVDMHPSVDTTQPWRAQMADLYGYRYLGLDSHFTRRHSGQLVNDHIHRLMPDVARGVEFLREDDNVDTVILVGHSGGGQVMALYQNIAENGVEDAGQGDEQIYPLPDFPDEDFPEADGLVISDAHTGYAGKGMLDLDPAIRNPRNPEARNQRLDFLNPRNGYNPDPDEPADYSDRFLNRFYPAQADRMDSLIEDNQNMLEKIESGRSRFEGDEPFLLLNANSSIYLADPTILSKTQYEWPLYHGIDSEFSEEEKTEEVIQSRRDHTIFPTYFKPPMEYDQWEVETISTRVFLSSRALKTTKDYQMTEDSIEGVEWESSSAQTPGNLKNIEDTPLLVLGATGFYFVTQSELHYKMAGSNDKTLKFFEGASHSFTAIDDKFGDVQSVLFEEWDNWVSERF